jgi:hypothetical protein
VVSERPTGTALGGEVGVSVILIATFQRRQERRNQNKARKNPTTTYPNPSLSFEEARTGAACWNTDKKPMVVDGVAHGVSCEQGEGRVRLRGGEVTI